jgi:hypothetical protein
MKITYEGAVYPLDLDEITVRQGQAIEKHTGGTLGDWEEGLGKASADCLQALGWLIFTGGDLSKPVGETDFKLLKLAKALQVAQEAEDPDPTGAASPPGGSSTSEPSPRSSASGRGKSAA